MRTSFVGAGPTGPSWDALLGAATRSTLVDRDPGRRTDWPGRGVMQFHHAHGFRGQVVDAIDLPGGERWRAAGQLSMPGRTGWTRLVPAAAALRPGTGVAGVDVDSGRRVVAHTGWEVGTPTG